MPDPDGGNNCTSAAVWLDTCALPPAGPALSLTTSGTYNYDTDTGALRNPSNNSVASTSVVVATATGDVRVIVVDSFTLGSTSTLRANGALPLAIVAPGEIAITGTLDVGRG